MHDVAQSMLNLERSTRLVGVRRGRARIESAMGTPVVYGDLVLPERDWSPGDDKPGRDRRGSRR